MITLWPAFGDRRAATRWKAPNCVTGNALKGLRANVEFSFDSSNPWEPNECLASAGKPRCSSRPRAGLAGWLCELRQERCSAVQHDSAHQVSESLDGHLPRKSILTCLPFREPADVAASQLLLFGDCNPPHISHPIVPEAPAQHNSVIPLLCTLGSVCTYSTCR